MSWQVGASWFDQATPAGTSPHGSRTYPHKGREKAIYTGYYIDNGYIYGPAKSGRYYIDNGYVYGPGSNGRYYLQNGYFYGPGSNGRFYVEGGYIYGPSKNLPWMNG